MQAPARAGGLWIAVDAALDPGRRPMVSTLAGTTGTLPPTEVCGRLAVGRESGAAFVVTATLDEG